MDLSGQEAFELWFIILFLKLFPLCQVCVNVDLPLIVLEEVIDSLSLSALVIVRELRLLVFESDLGNHS